MQFFCYTQGDDTIPMPPPSPELMQHMGQLVQDGLAAGILVATGGFAPSVTGATVALHDGEFTVTDGPYAEAKELIGGWALIRVHTRDEAVQWSKKFLANLGEGHCAVRQVFGPDDFAPDAADAEVPATVDATVTN